ncbi:MAG: hypothetical protein COA36_08885 [Desulfotalea sp.]|nr:MAG: hypothetical protein COA36_08885 [Desulfotalea sp.]
MLRQKAFIVIKGINLIMRTHLTERLYLSSPVFFQNILVSISGFIEHFCRYKGTYNDLSDQLFENEFKTKEELFAIEKKLLDEILNYAIQNVPYYQNLQIKSPSIENFPLLTRKTVFDNPENLLSKQHKNSKLIKLHTGGSTGNPLTIYLNKDIRRRTYAFWNRFYRIFDVKIRDKKASFVGRKLQHPDNNKPPFWRYNFYDNQLLFSSFHLSKQNLPCYIEKLNSFKPVIIEGYPLSILRIADYLIEHEIRLIFTPKGISTSSENFTNQQRKRIEKAFGCNVFDQYGSAESVVFACDCEHKNKHIAIEYGYVEVLDANGNLKREGEGELVVTTLINKVMPLIRYRIGDMGKISYKKCPCNRNYPILENLYGKVGAFIQANDKRVSTAALSISFEYLKNVEKSQIIQNEPNKIIVKLVVTSSFTEDEETFMLWELRKMLGETLAIEIQKVDNIPPTANGKYQMIIQNYYKD